MGAGRIAGAWRRQGLQPGRWALGARELAGGREGCGGVARMWGAGPAFP